ncbi:hypothetical protein PO909_001170 [Leuciscus waleckii]
MAVERCIGITKPLLHPAVVTMTRVRLTVLLIASTALTLAPQFPGTWCFLPVNGPLSIADANLALAFSILGLVTLSVSVVSNTISGLKLLQARFKDRCVKLNAARKHDVEMMTQLAGITVVSCVCWSPFLIYILISIGRFYKGISRPVRQCEKLFLLALRLASWNQILDPWVYILLRRAVLRRLLRLLQPDRAVFTQSSFDRDSHRKQMSLH